MNIILGKEKAEKLKPKYTLLELDSFKFKATDEPVQAYCVLELTDIDDFKNNNKNQELHEKLITDYRNKAWDSCLEIIDALYDSWSGDVNSFYDDLKARIVNLQSDCPDDWSYIVNRAA